MKPRTPWSPLDLVSAVFLISCAMVAGLSITDAVRLDPLPAAVEPRIPFVESDSGVSAPHPDTYLALQQHPFRVDRHPADSRYQRPGNEPVAAASSVPVPEFRLVGVAVRPGSPGLAAVVSGRESPRILRVGQELAEFRLTHVSRTGVRLVGQDTAITLALYPESEGGSP